MPDTEFLTLVHEWIISPLREDREAAREPFQGVTWSLDAHRNHRGPYTAAGELIRSIIPHAQRILPDLVQSHILTLLSIAPEIESAVPVHADVLRSFAFSREGNARSWTRRLSHGLTDFVLTFLKSSGSGPSAIVFENVHEADPLDEEFIAILLRRASPLELLLRIGTASTAIDEPLRSSLQSYARVVQVPSSRFPDAYNRDTLALAGQYIASNCTSDAPEAVAAYQLLSETERRRLHKERADTLLRSNERSLTLGAIPFHCEQAHTGMEHLLAASKYCMRMAYYHASLDWAIRGRKMASLQTDAKEHGEFTRNILFALMLLGRLEEVKQLCEENEISPDPAVRAHCTYAMAIMNARLYEPHQRDFDAARRWIGKSLEFTGQLPTSDTTIVNIAFLRNTLALVEMRQGRPQESIRLLTDALNYLQQNAPAKYEMECPILLNNRARVHALTGDSDRAIADYTLLLEHEPGNSEAHFDRGIIYQKLGRHSEALADYGLAVEWSPPYPEAYFNRAQVYAALGQTEKALADYSYVLLLDPDSLNARTNRACILYEQKEWKAAGKDVDHAIAMHPDNARLLCLDGLLKMKKQLYVEARQAFDHALTIEPGLPDIWVNRAALSFKEGAFESALDDLTHALSLREDPTTLCNRARVYQSQKRWHEAIADYTRALSLANANVKEITRQRGLCISAAAPKS